MSFTIMIIPIIQRSNDVGSSSSSRSFMVISLSLHEGKILARMSDIIKIKRILKIAIDTGFCDTSDSEERITFVKEENIVSSVYRFKVGHATFYLYKFLIYNFKHKVVVNSSMVHYIL